MSNRDKVLGLYRSVESSYTSEQWTTFAGPTEKIVSDFVPIVSQKANLSSLRGMSTYSPSDDWSIDHIHYYASLDMYNNTTKMKTYYETMKHKLQKFVRLMRLNSCKTLVLCSFND